MLLGLSFTESISHARLLDIAAMIDKQRDYDDVSYDVVSVSPFAVC